MNNMTYSYKPIVPDPGLTDRVSPDQKQWLSVLDWVVCQQLCVSSKIQVQIIDKLDRLGGEVHLYQKMVTGLILGHNSYCSRSFSNAMERLWLYFENDVHLKLWIHL